MANRGYQAVDKNIVDYGLWQLPDIGLYVRGPQVALDKPFFAVLGAAQTFGRFCDDPFPSLLSKALGIGVLNLGIAGAGPEFFVGRNNLFGLINRAEFVIVQVMSARSVSNSLFDVLHGGGTVKRKGSAESDRPMWAEAAYEEFFRQATLQERIALREETRANYIALMRELLSAISVKKILLYLSTLGPDYRDDDLKNFGSYFGGFPHFVTRKVISVLTDHADEYVEAVSARGLPQKLFNRFTGEPELVWPEDKFPQVKYRTSNNYYPSPEMHKEAFQALMRSTVINSIEHGY
jgi:hypothetical protein